MKKLEIICDGDSWVFGCEIVDPALSATFPKETHPGAYDYLESNDMYRIPKIFPTHLAKLFDAEVVNLSWPADDNGTILRRTMNYISSNYLRFNRSTENLLVIIGWSSPERNSFWYKDEKISRPFRLWPQVPHFDAAPQQEIWELYVSYMWHEEEYLPRYVMNVLQFQNFCHANNIKWLCFNSFYQTPKQQIDQWQDLDLKKELKILSTKSGGYGYHNSSSYWVRKYKNYDYVPLWNLIDPVRFYKKDMENNTFKSFIQNPENNISTPFNGWHPSPEGHRAWANELTRYIKEHNLI